MKRLRVAYADPPYLGQAHRYDHPRARDYNTIAGHARLLDRLVASYPDGWAYSLSSSSLQQILPLCPPDVRVGAWVKPFAIFKPGVNPAYCWEPVIFRGGRRRGRDHDTTRDFLSANITLRTGTHGAKPEAFAVWIFDLLGLEPGDRLDDLFPGSGAVTAAWRRWKKSRLERSDS